jgi:hypothetical protein
MLPPALTVWTPKQACNERLAACDAKYKRLRRLTRDQLEEEVLRAFKINIQVTRICDRSLAAVDTVWSQHQRKAAFPWRDRLLPVLRKSHPRRLDLAYWCGGVLCGLAIARLSDAKTWISITHIEGSPDPSHSLKGLVAPISVAGADIFATFVQREDSQGRLPLVRIMNPLTESIVVYEQCGYSALQTGNGYSYLVPRGEES